MSRHHLSPRRPALTDPPSSKSSDLPKLSSLGHFLKGSSATLGLTKVKDSCEKIQHGGKKDEEGTEDEPDTEKCLARIKHTLATVKEEYAEVEKSLKKFYGESVEGGTTTATSTGVTTAASTTTTTTALKRASYHFPYTLTHRP